jgi:hypothetical protein
VLEYLQEFIYYAYTFYTALLERNTFSDYRAGWLEALGNLTQYCIIIAGMVPTPLSFVLFNCCCCEWRPPNITCWLQYLLWHDDTPHVPVCLLQVWALLPHDSWSLNQRRIAGKGLLKSGTLRLLQNSLATVSCTIIWDFSAMSLLITFRSFSMITTLSLRLLVSLSSHYGRQRHSLTGMTLGSFVFLHGTLFTNGL